MLSLDAAGQEQRHLVAVAERRVEVWPDADGMSTVAAPLRADHAAAVFDALTDTARHPAGPHDERTMDQRRADALVTLITGTNPHGTPSSAPSTPETGARPARPGPGVNVTVALSTLLGLDEQPGELAGYGPVPAVLARRIAADPTGTWRRLVTDPHGQLLDYGRTVYRPPANLADHITTRDQTCRMPGCSRPAITCELDHIIAWDDGGHTNQINVSCPVRTAPPRETRSRLADHPQPAHRHHPLHQPHRPPLHANPPTHSPSTPPPPRLLPMTATQRPTLQRRTTPLTKPARSDPPF